jgi:hypothetical protein
MLFWLGWINYHRVRFHKVQPALTFGLFGTPLIACSLFHHAQYDIFVRCSHPVLDF